MDSTTTSPKTSHPPSLIYLMNTLLGIIKTTANTTPQSSNIQPIMVTNYTIGWVEYKTISTKRKHERTEVLYSNLFYSTLDDKGKLNLIKQIVAKEQVIFAAYTISANDVEKLVNHYSCYKTVAECQRNMPKFELNAVFTVVSLFFSEDSGVNGTNSAGQLKKDNNTNLKNINLVDNYLCCSVNNIIQSSLWYSSFINNATCF